jgi:hypothetical protein
LTSEFVDNIVVIHSLAAVKHSLFILYSFLTFRFLSYQTPVDKRVHRQRCDAATAALGGGDATFATTVDTLTFAVVNISININISIIVVVVVVVAAVCVVSAHVARPRFRRRRRRRRARGRALLRRRRHRRPIESV